MRRESKAVLLVLLCYSIGVFAEPPSPWFVGPWEKTQDEDHDRPDTLRFLPDGRVVTYGPHCEEKQFRYHLHEANIYLDIEIPGKGPVALVYRPNREHSALVFTSPRTLNNATYERVAKPTCGGA